MKALFTLLAAALTIGLGYSQDIKQPLDHFNKVIVSHKINLVLIPGDKESVRITYSGVDPEKIIIYQSGKRLHIYLENAKFFDLGERTHDMFDRRERYRHANVTAYVTFKEDLRLIESRGEGDVTCDGRIVSKKVKVRAYGETDLRFAYLEAATVRARLYGANTLKVADGDAGHLSYKLYGENKVDSRGLRTVTSNTTIYGAGKVSVYATEEVRLTSFGDPSLLVTGSPTISKGIVIGSANIRRN